MKLILTILAAFAVSYITAPQNGQEPQRFSYQVQGTVLDEESRTMPHLTVCLLPAERPINGRIPCTKTDDAGVFAMTVKDIPDKYIVCATTTESPFIFKDDKDPTHRVTCSKVIEFPAKDDCRKVNLKFETKSRD